MASLTDLPQSVIREVLQFCTQHDTLQLATTCRLLHTLSVEKLYEKLHICSSPGMKRGASTSFSSEVAGMSSIFKRPDQNDYLLYLKLVVLSQSLEKYGELVKQCVVFDDVFSDGNTSYLNDFVKTLELRCPNLERFVSYDENIKNPDGASLKNFITSDLKELDHITHAIDSLTVRLHRYTEQLELPDLTKLSSIKELILDDEESSSLRLLKLLSESGLPSKLQLKRLVFNHVHGLHDYNMVLRQLTTEFVDSCIDLSSLQELEMTIGCQEEGCDCLAVFLDDLAPKVKNLKRVALHEQTFHKDHYLTEQWDVDVGRFLIKVEKGLKFVSVRHNPPMDGKLLNGLEGNYLRRRKLYEAIVPQLTCLETFSCPTFIQSCACYEVLPSDLLWNGCECSFCQQFLPIYDKYLMDHAYYDDEMTGFKDMISPRLFGMFGTQLSKRQLTKFDLDSLKYPPSTATWDFHDSNKTITCFNDVDKCVFDQKLFEPLVVCCSHFMRDTVVQYMVKHCPNLKRVVLNGVVFTIGTDGVVGCVYDGEEEVYN